MDKPKVITLCGSSRFCDIMAVCAWLLEKDEHVITLGLHLLPDWYSKDDIPSHLAEHEGVAKDMDALHCKKIDISDGIFVVNYNNYVGTSTLQEVYYAISKGLPIRWFTHDLIGNKATEILHDAIAKRRHF